MEEWGGRNQTPIVEFILSGFGNGPEMQPFLFLLFLVIYVATVAGNILIISLVVADQHLHIPMYYFVGNLSWLEICYTSIILPRLLASLLTGDQTISITGCIVQLYFFGLTSATENLMLTAMSYDRYLAICNPLRYAILMNGRICCRLVAVCWISSFLGCTIGHTFFLHSTFCNSQEIDHFFCDMSPILKLSCGDSRAHQMFTFIISAIGTLIPCFLTLTSYICIITSILKISSTMGRKKAFSTCSSHLIVVTVYYVTVITVYVSPTTSTHKVLHKIFSVFYTVLTPLINPVIYCLRNESLKNTILKVVAGRNLNRI